MTIYTRYTLSTKSLINQICGSTINYECSCIYEIFKTEKTQRIHIMYKNT